MQQSFARFVLGYRCLGLGFGRGMDEREWLTIPMRRNTRHPAWHHLCYLEIADDIALCTPTRWKKQNSYCTRLKALLKPNYCIDRHNARHMSFNRDDIHTLQIAEGSEIESAGDINSVVGYSMWQCDTHKRTLWYLVWRLTCCTRLGAYSVLAQSYQTKRIPGDG